MTQVVRTSVLIVRRTLARVMPLYPTQESAMPVSVMRVLVTQVLGMLPFAPRCARGVAAAISLAVAPRVPSSAPVRIDAVAYVMAPAAIATSIAREQFCVQPCAVVVRHATSNAMARITVTVWSARPAQAALSAAARRADAILQSAKARSRAALAASSYAIEPARPEAWRRTQRKRMRKRGLEPPRTTDADQFRGRSPLVVVPAAITRIWVRTQTQGRVR